MKPYPKHLEEMVARELEPGEVTQPPYVAAMTYPRFAWLFAWMAPRLVYRKLWLVVTDRRVLIIRAKWLNLKPKFVKHAIDRTQLTASWEKMGPFRVRKGLILNFGENTMRIVFGFVGSWSLPSRRANKAWPSRGAKKAWSAVISSIVSGPTGGESKVA